MKRIIIATLVAVIATGWVAAKPAVKKSSGNVPAAQQEKTVAATEPKVSVTDSVINVITNGKRVAIKYADLEKFVNRHLDDTLLNMAEADEGTEDEATTLSYSYRQQEADMAREGMSLARDIARYFAWSLMVVVFMVLLFYYMHRRRKYKTIDNAIKNNYPLPDEFFGKRVARAPQPPTTVYVNHIAPPAPDASAPQGSQPAPGAMPPYRASGNPLNNITDWAPFKSGIYTLAWGIGLMLFFWIAGAAPIAALMTIVILIGLYKIFTVYQEQQSLRNFWQQQQWMQQSGQQAHQAPSNPESKVPPIE